VSRLFEFAWKGQLRQLYPTVQVSPRAAAAAIDAVRRVCVVSANAANVMPAKQLAVTLSVTDGASSNQAAQVPWGRGRQSVQACLRGNCNRRAPTMSLHHWPAYGGLVLSAPLLYIESCVSGSPLCLLLCSARAALLLLLMMMRLL